MCMVMLVHTLRFLVPSPWSCVTEFLWPGCPSLHGILLYLVNKAMLLCRCGMYITCPSWCQSQVSQHQLTCFAVNVCCCTFQHACNLQLMCQQDSCGLSQSNGWKLRQMTYLSNMLWCQEISMDSCVWTVSRTWLAPENTGQHWQWLSCMQRWLDFEQLQCHSNPARCRRKTR